MILEKLEWEDWTFISAECNPLLRWYQTSQAETQDFASPLSSANLQHCQWRSRGAVSRPLLLLTTRVVSASISNYKHSWNKWKTRKIWQRRILSKEREDTKKNQVDILVLKYTVTEEKKKKPQWGGLTANLAKDRPKNLSEHQTG